MCRSSISRLSINSGFAAKRVFIHDLRCLSSISNNASVLDSINSSKHSCGHHQNHGLCNSSCHCYHTSSSLSSKSMNRFNNANNTNQLHFFQTRLNSSQQRDSADGNENEQRVETDEDENDQIESDETENEYEDRV